MEVTTTEKMLLDRFGGSPLLSTQQVAEILHRSPEGLRITMSGNTDVAQLLRSCKLKIGRRVYFRVSSIAQLIDEA
ncbi:DNA-binding protein [Bordetella sp. BOR01]|uniref:DNA-binding protein n=1 Tax=Bordetella sp. BOR01 TaxID=2854779 RepID=UPI00351CF938